MSFYEKIERAIIEGKLIRKTFAFIKKLFRKGWKVLDFQLSRPFRNAYVRKQKIVKNRIVLTAVDNRYDCNIKYIAEEIIRRKLPYEIVWIRTKPKTLENEGFPKQIRVVNRDSIEAIDALATAKIWIENELKLLKPYSVHKKKGQVYIQTWHGSMGFKKIGRANLYNIKGRKKLLITKVAKLCNETTDYCVANSEFEKDVFRESYWDDTPILMYGHARNDILLTDDKAKLQAIKEKVLTFYGVIPAIPYNMNELSEKEQTRILKMREEGMHSKYLLYAPTYRKDLSLEYFDIDFSRLKSALEKRFGGEWKIILRFHFHNRTVGEKMAKNPLFINATDYPDMQELMAMADVGISDYSSWLCDYVLTKRPAYIYGRDYESYSQTRGFYYPLNTTPFPISIDNDQLENSILNFNAEKYENDCKRFLKERGCIEEGNAAVKIVDLIENVMENRVVEEK